MVLRSSYKEENKVTHWMDSEAHAGNFNVRVFDEPLEGLKEMMRKDKNLGGQARIIGSGVYARFGPLGLTKKKGRKNYI